MASKLYIINTSSFPNYLKHIKNLNKTSIIKLDIFCVYLLLDKII